MKVARFLYEAEEHWGFVVDGSAVAPVRTEVSLVDSLVDGFSNRSADRMQHVSSIPLTEVRLLTPIPAPPQFVGIGLNYRDHAKETGQQPPPAPIMFPFLLNAIANPEDPIEIPGFTQQVDWEAELGVVIGVGGKDIPLQGALDHVAGYVIVNDISARDIQLEEGQWSRAKSFDTFKPVGPWITTVDEVGDAKGLGVTLWINNELKQSSSTSELIFDVPNLVSLLSRALTLQPGMIISTGTPSGVGFTRSPAEFLQPGDVVTIEIEGLGRLSNPVVETGRKLVPEQADRVILS